MIKRICHTVLFILIFSSIATADIFLPVNQPEYKFLYDGARKYETEVGFYYDNYMAGPYNFNRQSFDFPLKKFIDDQNNDYLKLFGSVSEDFTARKEARGDGIEKIRAGFTAQPTDGFSVYANFILDEAMADDPTYTGKKWHGLAGEVENSYVAYNKRQFEIIFGRFGSFWGPDNNSLVLSDEARPMDAALIRYHWGRLHYTFQFSKLSMVVEFTDSTNMTYNRYFSGHRLDFRLYDNLNIGLFETIIFGGENRTIEFSYLNPFNFFHGEQLNENYDDNTFLGLDITWYLYNRVKLYGQFLADDIQVDDSEAGDNEPNEFGIILGLEGVNLFDWLDMKLRYQRITNRTYNQKLSFNRYDNRGALIGNSNGPDGDILSAEFAKWFDYRYRVMLNLAYQRQGAGRYDDPWTEPWLDVDNYDEPFPTGDVLKRYNASLRFTGFWRDIIFLDCEGGLDYLKQEGIGLDDAFPYFKINISTFFSTSILID